MAIEIKSIHISLPEDRELTPEEQELVDNMATTIQKQIEEDMEQILEQCTFTPTIESSGQHLPFNVCRGQWQRQGNKVWIGDIYIDEEKNDDKEN